MSEMEWDAMVTVGRIVRPHGRRGEVVVESESDFAGDRFQPGARFYWRRASDAVCVEVTSSRPHDARWVIGLAGVDSIDAAEAIRGLELRVPASDLRPLGPGAFYAHDLVGCRVETVTGAGVGEVSSVMFGGGPPLLAIAGADGEVLVPMAADICRTIDVAGRRIVIDPPEGLLELNRGTPRA